MTSGVRFSSPLSVQDPLNGHLRQWIGHQRFMRNAKTRERNAAYLEGRHHEDSQKYAHLVTEETAFLSDVPSQILRNGAVRFYAGLQRFRAGLGGAPKIKRRHGRQSVLITKELFRFLPMPVTGRSDREGWVIELGTKANPVGRLSFHAHRAWSLPNQIIISVEPSGRWFVSFSYEGEAIEVDRKGAARDLSAADHIRTAEELLYEIQGLPDLEDRVWAGDRGVHTPLAGSDGKTWDFSDVHKARLARAESGKRKYQKRMARAQKVKGADGKSRVSQGYLKLKRKAAKKAEYGRNVRQEFAHQTSHALVASNAEVFAFEDLKIKNMTAAPAPKLDAEGRWARNGSAAKAGLNAAILRSAWGSVQRFTTYKAKKRNKLVYKLPPAYSSQTCSRCGHRDAGNRKGQLFACLSCGHQADADVNAARVLKLWTIEKVRSGDLPAEEQRRKKRVAFARKRTRALEKEHLEVTSDQERTGHLEAGASNGSAFHAVA
ncbi:Transposase [Variovorax sp. HW608]|uniref:RNA-guided endonuclease InsQ/TnpB family protein n=1 Tax=Variovorax sp. HW608 TaxID=1034889 RepID=UPI00081F82DF|nr:RNA-guided endonuclease TnpB family protein [Variovorax sp. HW608]SCK37900.1 Transposase [Variovorax sp. HW608]